MSDSFVCASISPEEEKYLALHRAALEARTKVEEFIAEAKKHDQKDVAQSWCTSTAVLLFEIWERHYQEKLGKALEARIKNAT